MSAPVAVNFVDDFLWKEWMFWVAFAAAVLIHTLVFARALLRFYNQSVYNSVTALGGTIASLAFLGIAGLLVDSSYFIAVSPRVSTDSVPFVAPILFLGLAIIYAAIEIDFVALLKFGWVTVLGGSVVASKRVQTFLETYSHRGPYGAATRPLVGFGLIFASAYIPSYGYRVPVTIIGALSYACFIVYHFIRVAALTADLAGDGNGRSLMEGKRTFLTIIVMHTLAQFAGAIAIIIASGATYLRQWSIDAAYALPILVISSLGLYALSMIAAMVLPQTDNDYYGPNGDKTNKVRRATISGKM